MARIDNVEQYLRVHNNWKAELEKLRMFLLSFPLKESIKWGAPVYSMENKNIVGIGAFKKHYALWLFQGGELQENTALLYNAQEGKTKTLRQIRFTEGSIIDPTALYPYIEEAIKVAKLEKKVKPVNVQKLIISPEFLEMFKENPHLEAAFTNLSPGKQREYINFISETKREDTRSKRWEKILPLILEGKGLHDKYKSK